MAETAPRASPSAAQSAALTASIESRTTSSACARRAPAALNELDGNPTPVHLLGDLRPGAVHDDDFVALLGEPEDAVGRVAGDGAADLDDRRLTTGSPR